MGGGAGAIGDGTHGKKVPAPSTSSSPSFTPPSPHSMPMCCLSTNQALCGEHVWRAKLSPDPTPLRLKPQTPQGWLRETSGTLLAVGAFGSVSFTN